MGNNGFPFLVGDNKLSRASCPHLNPLHPSPFSTRIITSVIMNRLKYILKRIINKQNILLTNKNLHSSNSKLTKYHLDFFDNIHAHSIHINQTVIIVCCKHFSNTAVEEVETIQIQQSANSAIIKDHLRTTQMNCNTAISL